MRFGQSETAFLKPEDNGDWDWGDQEMEGGEEMMGEPPVVFDFVEDNKDSNKSKVEN